MTNVVFAQVAVSAKAKVFTLNLEFKGKEKTINTPVEDGTQYTLAIEGVKTLASMLKPEYNYDVELNRKEFVGYFKKWNTKPTGVNKHLVEELFAILKEGGWDYCEVSSDDETVVLYHTQTQNLVVLHPSDLEPNWEEVETTTSVDTPVTVEVATHTITQKEAKTMNTITPNYKIVRHLENGSTDVSVEFSTLAPEDLSEKILLEDTFTVKVEIFSLEGELLNENSLVTEDDNSTIPNTPPTPVQHKEQTMKIQPNYKVVRHLVDGTQSTSVEFSTLSPEDLSEKILLEDTYTMRVEVLSIEGELLTENNLTIEEDATSPTTPQPKEEDMVKAIRLGHLTEETLSLLRVDLKGIEKKAITLKEWYGKPGLLSITDKLEKYKGLSFNRVSIVKMEGVHTEDRPFCPKGADMEKPVCFLLLGKDSTLTLSGTKLENTQLAYLERGADAVVNSFKFSPSGFCVVFYTDKNQEYKLAQPLDVSKYNVQTFEKPEGYKEAPLFTLVETKVKTEEVVFNYIVLMNSGDTIEVETKRTIQGTHIKWDGGVAFGSNLDEALNSTGMDWVFYEAVPSSVQVIESREKTPVEEESPVKEETVKLMNMNTGEVFTHSFKMDDRGWYITSTGMAFRTTYDAVKVEFHKKAEIVEEVVASVTEADLEAKYKEMVELQILDCDVAILTKDMFSFDSKMQQIFDVAGVDSVKINIDNEKDDISNWVYENDSMSEEEIYLSCAHYILTGHLIGYRLCVAMSICKSNLTQEEVVAILSN